jgi:FtsH-binding integral membrane protein
MDTELTRRNKIGLVLIAIFGLVNIPSPLLAGDPDPGQDSPPMAVLVLAAVCGAVMLVAAIQAYRTGSRQALRLAAGATILQGVTNLPVFFVDVDAAIKVGSAVATVVTVVCVVLVLAPARRAVPVLD